MNENLIVFDKIEGLGGVTSTALSKESLSPENWMDFQRFWIENDPRRAQITTNTPAEDPLGARQSIWEPWITYL